MGGADHPRRLSLRRRAALSAGLLTALAVPAAVAIRSDPSRPPPTRPPTDQSPPLKVVAALPTQQVSGYVDSGNPDPLLDVVEVRIRPDGHVIAIGGYATSDPVGDSIGDATTGEAVAILRNHRIVISPDGSTAVVKRRDTASTVVTLIDSRTGAQHRLPTPSRPLAEAFTPDGQTLTTLHPDSRLIHWDPAQGTQRGSGTVTGDTDAPTSMIAISPDLRRAATMRTTGAIHVWDTSTGQPIGPALVQDSKANPTTKRPALRFSFDGQLLATIDKNGTGQLWQLPDLTQLASLGPTNYLAFSPDRALLGASTQDGNKIWIWDLRDRPLTPVDDIQWIGPSTGALAFSTNGKLLATTGANRLIQIWPVQTP